MRRPYPYLCYPSTRNFRKFRVFRGSQKSGQRLETLKFEFEAVKACGAFDAEKVLTMGMGKCLNFIEGMCDRTYFVHFPAHYGQFVESDMAGIGVGLFVVEKDTSGPGIVSGGIEGGGIVWGHVEIFGEKLPVMGVAT